MIRLRQVALAARDLDSSVAALCTTFGLSVCYRDPGVAEFGLVNALMLVGDQFLEVVAPATTGTTAGRLLDKRCAHNPSDGVTGYMAIYEVDDLDAREQHVLAHGARVVWRGDFGSIRGRHLHPADVGGAIVSIDQPTPQGSWRWAGTDWVAHSDTSVVTAIAGIAIGAHDPDAMRARWSELGLQHAVHFQPAGDNSEGIDELQLVATDRARAGEVHSIGGFLVRLV
ncbi:MAG: VOC family protein [Actinomycetota bacterium]